MRIEAVAGMVHLADDVVAEIRRVPRAGVVARMAGRPSGGSLLRTCHSDKARRARRAGQRKQPQ